MRVVLGLDTSNYTTSVSAVCLETGAVIAEERMLLPVAAGDVGLRQSDAVFHHLKQLPTLMDRLVGQVVSRVGRPNWSGVGVSVRPRPLAASYMPVFQVGRAFAYSIARTHSVPLICTSHQEGHLAAAVGGTTTSEPGPCIAVHLSGGTSDVLLAVPTRFGYRITPVGEGADLHAGQFVDRVGVALGGPFPAGPWLEKLAETAVDSTFRLPTRVIGAQLSFSGPCSAAMRAIAAGESPAEVAAAVQLSIATGLEKAIRYAVSDYPAAAFCVVAGGVASNAAIRSRLIHRLHIHFPDLPVRFAPPGLSSDNAVGPAFIARRFLLND